jgi:transposase InsO family protein
MSNDALIAQHGIQARHKRKYIATMNSNHGLPVAPNWLWTSDTTYVAKAEGRPYLAVITDPISRQVVGWSMQPHTKAGLVADALRMARSRRHPDAGVIMHSDRGSQYVAGCFRTRWRRMTCILQRAVAAIVGTMR